MFAFFLQLFKFRSKTSYHLLMPIHTTAFSLYRAIRAAPFELFRTLWSPRCSVHGMNSMLMVTSLVPFGSGTVRQRVELGTSRTTSALHSRRKFFFSIWKEASLLLRSYGRLARSVCIIHQMSILTFQSEIFRKIRQSFRKSFSKI